MLLRHAEAVPTGPESKRPLTPEGRLASLRLGQGLSKLDLVPEVILSSPLWRARETVECLVEGFAGQPTAVQICSELEPGATPAQLMKLLSEQPSRRRTMIVGHQPDLGRMLSFLLSGGSMELEFSIRPGTICVADVDSIPLKGPGRLILLAGPAILGNIA